MEITFTDSIKAEAWFALDAAKQVLLTGKVDGGEYCREDMVADLADTYQEVGMFPLRIVRVLERVGKMLIDGKSSDASVVDVIEKGVSEWTPSTY